MVSYLLLILLINNFLIRKVESESENINKGWIYEPGHQFPNNSENIILPPILLYSIYMGEVNYDYIEYTLESMRYNSKVDFVIINILEDIKTSNHTFKNHLKHHYNRIPINKNNIHVHEITIRDFSYLVYSKLNIPVHHHMNSSWYYKMCDYKPTLAYLFPEYLKKKDFLYWGYADLDLIWGNITKFSHLFYNHTFPIVISGWFHSTGAATFYENKRWTIELFKSDPLYVKLLANMTYHNLDEMGIQIPETAVIDSGQHSINSLQSIALQSVEPPIPRNHGRIPEDHMFIDAGDVNEWAGKVTWKQGELMIMNSSKFFPPQRQLMFFHRPHKFLKYPYHQRHHMIAIGKIAGFELPNWKLLCEPNCK